MRVKTADGREPASPVRAFDAHDVIMRLLVTNRRDAIRSASSDVLVNVSTHCLTTLHQLPRSARQINLRLSGISIRSWKHRAKQQSVTVRLDHGETRSVKIGRGVRQGCCLSPIVFNLSRD